ncbi:hypothetical protein ABB02_00396 [Clostridiaceae bacterium JG1575]|nr:hypothetical protein ABB02_00396 [Clostridiaceae bacterium JG1575]
MKKGTKIVLSIVLFVGLLVGLRALYQRAVRPNPLAPIAAGEGEGKGKTTAAKASDTGSTAPTATAASKPAAPKTLPLPDLKVYDSKGQPVRISTFYGKPMVLNVWASWCGPCKAEMPEFLQLDQEIGQDVNIVMVNMTGGFETREQSDAFLKSQKLNFQTMLYDNDQDLATKLGIQSIPTTIFVDAKGQVHFYHTGTLSKDQVREVLGRMKQQ